MKSLWFLHIICNIEVNTNIYVEPFADKIVIQIHANSFQ